MANPNAVKDADGLDLDLIAGIDGTVYIKAAGDAETMTGGWDDQRAPQQVQDVKAGTATRTSVTSAAADTLLLAANVARKGAIVYNVVDKILYLGLGTTAVTTTNYTEQVAAGGRWVQPFPFRGQIRGIWAAAPTGSARVTELT